jgi:Trk-type K+ transport system membrane component
MGKLNHRKPHFFALNFNLQNSTPHHLPLLKPFANHSTQIFDSVIWKQNARFDVVFLFLFFVLLCVITFTLYSLSPFLLIQARSLARQLVRFANRKKGF